MIAERSPLETAMLGAAIAQIRFAVALGLGRPIPGWALDRLVYAARDTAHEFGPLSQAEAEVEAGIGPALDAETRRAVQLRRLRAQATRAARETDYYGRLFADLPLDPGKLTWDEIARLPVTPKSALRDDPDAFVCRSADVALRTTTTGTTGRPTRVCFSAPELRTIVGLSALAHLFAGQLAPDDVVLMATSFRGSLGNAGLAGTCAKIGALLVPLGLVEPAVTLELLAERLRLPGKKSKVSAIVTYSSALGELVEAGLARGYGPADFGLERIDVGGEILTEGLQARARQLFGEVRFDSGYAMTETFPFGGTLCEQGHLHLVSAHGLLEVLDPETGQPAADGAVGTLVATPFPPFRETTLLLRYDTEDLVRPLAGPLSCRLRQRPATSNLLGKRRLAVRHDEGWTYPREVFEALEAVEAVPLPARCGCWATTGGVGIDVVVRRDTADTRREVTRSLEERGVPVRELRLVTDRSALRHPYPLRCDLRELGFGGTGTIPILDVDPGRGLSGEATEAFVLALAPRPANSRTVTVGGGR